jgi:hypothetical protein
MENNFDFDNPEKHLPSKSTPETQANVDKIDNAIGETVLSSYDSDFIVNIRKKVLAGKHLTVNQTNHLARVMASCKSGKYIAKPPRVTVKRTLQASSRVTVDGPKDSLVTTHEPPDHEWN